MRTDSPLLKFYYSKLKKFGPGGQTTDGCGPGYSKNPLTGECLPNGWTPSGHTSLAGVTNQSKTSASTPSYGPSSESVGTGITSLQRNPELERQIDIAKQLAKQPRIPKQSQIKQGRKSTPAEEAERKRKNIIYASQQPNAQIDEQGNVSRVNPNRSVTGEAENFMSRREDQKGEDAVRALEIAGALEGAGALGSLAKKAIGKKVVQSMESGLLSKAHKLNPRALMEKDIVPEGTVARQIFGDEAYENFLKYGPTTRPGVHEGQQLIQFATAPSSQVRLASGEIINIAPTMESGQYLYPYFSEGKLWYGPREVKNFSGKQRIITTPSSEVFRPAGETSVIRGEPSQSAIETFAGRRRVLMPGTEYADPKLYKVYEPDWWKGFKEVPFNKYKPGGTTTDSFKCGPKQIYLEGVGCIDIGSKMYQELYNAGKLGQRDADGNLVTWLPEVVVKSKMTPEQKAAYHRKLMQQDAIQNAFENQATIGPAKEQPLYERAWDIATHPFTAIRSYNKMGYVPSNLGAVAAQDDAGAAMLNTASPAVWARGLYGAGKQLLTHPVQTPIDVVQGAGNLLGWGLHNSWLGNPLPGQTKPEYVSPFGDPGTNTRALEFVGNVGDAAPIFEFIGPAAKLSKAGLRNSVDLVSPVGKELRSIKRYGKLNNLSESEIKNLQMQRVGITSKQREGYFPGVSEILTEYLTPYGYDNIGKRLLNIPKRIIKGETNTKKISNSLSDVIMDQGQTLLSKPRYDAWRMYSGLPQKHGTFRLAETSPLNHSSYPKGLLDDTEIFSLNDEKRLLNDVPNKEDLLRYHYNKESLVDDLDYLKNTQSELDQLNNSTKLYTSDFGTTNVMGGHNRRFFDNKMEYNDIWDLNPGNLKVEKYFGKPFMSHGQVPYNINDVQSVLRHFIKEGERLKEYPNIKINPYKDRMLTEKFDNLINTIPNYQNLIKTTTIKKQEQGGLTQYANGGDISIPALTTKMPPLLLGGSIQMKPKESPLLNYYLQRTGGKRMIR